MWYDRYVRYTPLALVLSAFWGWAPLCFLFFVFPSRPLPLTPPGRVLPVRLKTLALGDDGRVRGACPFAERMHERAFGSRDIPVWRTGYRRAGPRVAVGPTVGGIT